eukprot:TRINITY_DN2828_c1_g2_i2.p1 TRINITY_DN2828_c1_g2~~TRINITY_DN2828_c1_g2_i2.p1  ORF type:complete len:303 (+),score=54.07 TRINITY_DN2828_c1_g2_i2:63-971(+)
MLSSFIGPFRVGKQLGAGSCASVYQGVDTRTGKPVAIKMCPLEDETLPVEVEVLKRLEQSQGFAKLHWHGDAPNGEGSALVTDLLGTSLGGLVQSRGQLDTCTALRLAIQLLSRVQDLHRQKFVHRDIKPDNCLLGRGSESDRVFLIDFGLSQPYVDAGTESHVAYADNMGFSGTPDFSSVRSHSGVRQTRRDDLESLGYVLVYLLRGHLPWMGLRGLTEEEVFAKVARCKETTTVEDLCRGCPAEVREYLTYVRGLHYNKEPDYAMLRALLQRAVRAAGGNSGDERISGGAANGKRRPAKL